MEFAFRDCLVRNGGIIEARPNRTGHTVILFCTPVTCESSPSLIYRFLCLVHSNRIVMRNIAISGTWSSAIPDGNITTGIVDVDRGCLWITSEQLNADADTEIDIYKKELPGDSYEEKDVSPPTQGSEFTSQTRRAMQIHCHHR